MTEELVKPARPGQVGSIVQTRRLLNARIEVLRRRLEAERVAFVRQIQTRQALDGIDHFLRRQDHV